MVLKKKDDGSNVLSLSNTEAREHFLKAESFVDFDFSNLLKEVSKILSSSNLSGYYEDEDKPCNYEEVNYILYSNKEGKYSWRPLQIINPALYVSFVHLITKEENWRDIKERFKEFQADHNIICMSIPIVSTTKRADKAEQISFWYNNVEHESLRLVMEFD